MKPGPKPKGKVPIKWSPGFAYAIGLFTADGCLLNDGRHLDFTSKDRDQVETFKKCLGLQVKIGTKLSGVGNKCYRVQFGDVLFYEFLKGIGFSTAKSKTLSSVSVPDKYFSDFLRGYFDGDGTSYSFYDSVYPNSYRFYVAFASASPLFVRWLRTEIQRMIGTKGHVSTSPNKRYQQLKYSKHEAIEVCKHMYHAEAVPFLKRKRLKIERTLSIIGL